MGISIHYGSGYRVHFTRRDGTVILLLCGGVKKGQDADIAHAKRLEGAISDDS